MCMTPLSDHDDKAQAQPQLPPELVETLSEKSGDHPKVWCARCDTPNEPGYNFCQRCGWRLAASQVLHEGETVEISNLSHAPTPRMPNRLEPPDHYKTTPTGNASLLCSNCGSESLPGSLFCNLCGTQLSVDQTVAMPTPKPSPKFRLRVIVDGEESDEVYDLGTRMVIGRVKGDINFPHDDYMSGRHASVRRDGNRFVLKDEGSRNGTFVLLSGEAELKPGDVFMVGKQLFKFEASE